jgi:hypothetical protein
MSQGRLLVTIQGANPICDPSDRSINTTESYIFGLLTTLNDLEVIAVSLAYTSFVFLPEKLK